MLKLVLSKMVGRTANTNMTDQELQKEESSLNS